MIARLAVVLRLRALAIAALLICVPVDASAKIERYAVLIGNNVGLPSEVELRYAESDAQRMYDVLKDLGGFSPANMILLRGESADVARRTLAEVNERVQRATATPETQVLFFVYYSGHADAVAMHLGNTLLEFTHVAQLVRGSTATFRLLLVDSCRSGVLTRVKGGQAAMPFAVRVDDRFSGQGTVVITSSSVNEDAQESDELKGSFFTHGFVSGLLGAADTDGDLAVTLEEAYRHAYDATLRATSRTLAGTQHPTFQYDLRGRGRIVLTSLDARASGRATLRFPPDRAYLVLQGSSSGAVIGEVTRDDASRKLSLKPGRYFVRGRGPDFLLEGALTLATNETREVRDDDLTRLEYARLVRKGHGGHDGIRVAHGPQAGYIGRTALPNADAPCHGVFAGYALAFEALTLTPRLGACRSGYENATLAATTDELAIEVRATRAFDTRRLAFDVGVTGGAALLRQAFETRGVAEPRLTAAGTVGLTASVALDLAGGFYALAGLDAQTYFFQYQTDDRTALGAFFALRASAGFGTHF